jgi:hypothetical protein
MSYFFKKNLLKLLSIFVIIPLFGYNFAAQVDSQSVNEDASLLAQADLSSSLNNDQKSLSITDYNEYTFLKSLYLPNIETLNLKVFPLGDISWMNESFPNVKNINVEWHGNPNNKGYNLSILNLLNQFPLMENLYIAINKMTPHLFSDKIQAAILARTTLKEFRMTFTIHRGFFDIKLYNDLKLAKENMKQLTKTIINFNFNVWETILGDVIMNSYNI